MLNKRNMLKNKYGFSLFEVVVTMSIIAIFIAAASNVFTQKFKRRVALPAHGRFECYYDNEGKLHEKQVADNVIVRDNDVSDTGYCSFEPVKASAYLVINAVAGGGAGGETTGGSAGTFRSIFLPTTTHRLKVIPGKGSVYGSDELSETQKATVIYDMDTGGESGRIVVNLAGGVSDSGNINKAQVSYCNISLAKFLCKREPFCAVDNKTRVLNVGYCKANGEDIKNEVKEKLTFSDLITKAMADGVDLKNHQIITHNKYTEEYTDTNYALAKEDVVYALAILFDGNFTEHADVSTFQEYIKALEVENGIADVTCLPGNGGAKQASGCDGAVVLTW